MAKSHPFSIFLLKPNFDHTRALVDPEHRLTPSQGSKLPANASLFLLDAPPTEPWWKDCFGIQQPLFRAHKGALIFLPVRARTFVLSFGHVHHYLNDESYEHDFGIRVTLNSVDPNKLRIADSLEPGPARRRRTQIPSHSNLAALDFDRDTSILKRLTGYTSEDSADLFGHATGSSSLRISIPCDPTSWNALCQRLLDLYTSKTYEEIFPDIQSVTPVRDPKVLDALNVRLIDGLVEDAGDIYLAVPEFIDDLSASHASFSGAGPSLVYDDVYADLYYHYLESHGIDRRALTVEHLKKHRLHLTDAEGLVIRSYPIRRCLVFDTRLVGTGGTFHLNDGDWYAVDDDYVARLHDFLDPLWIDLSLPDYTQAREAEYNKSVAAGSPGMLCLDMKDISPAGQSQVEPCDLYSVENGVATFYHIKVSTLSSQLSHLFNQGSNAIQLLKLDAEAAAKMESLIETEAGPGAESRFKSPFSNGPWRVLFGIVSHKDKLLRSENLPLFSRISLMRVMKDMKLMAVDASFGFVRNLRPKKPGVPKPRKKKR